MRALAFHGVEDVRCERVREPTVEASGVVFEQ
jgi:hypothetical protein